MNATNRARSAQLLHVMQIKLTADADDVDRLVEVLHVFEVHRVLGGLLPPLLFMYVCTITLL